VASESPKPDAAQLSRYRDFAAEVAREAGLTALRYFRSGVEVETKSDETPVTRADRETERFIRGALSERYPDHLVIGEEFGASRGGKPVSGEAQGEGAFRWVVDPIDGTKAFIHGVPLFTTLIALLHEGRPVVGIIHNPVLEETCSAAVGCGCTLNGSACRVSTVDSLERGRLHSTDFSDLYRAAPALAAKLLGRAGAARTWADGYGYLMVATGRAEAMIDPVMSLWDIAPLGPVITEAGGRFTAIDGTETWTGTSGLATNGLVHEQILRLASAGSPQ